MLKMNVDKTNEKAISLNVSGELTVINISQLHKKLIELMDFTDDLTLVLEDNTGIDMTFIQLICTAHRAYSQAGKKFAVGGENEDIFNRTDTMGFTRHKGCSFDTFRNCVLVKKEN